MTDDHRDFGATIGLSAIDLAVRDFVREARRLRHKYASQMIIKRAYRVADTVRANGQRVAVFRFPYSGRP